MSGGELILSRRHLAVYTVEVAERVGLTLNDLAFQVGSTSSELWKELSRDSSARAEVVAAVADALDVTLESLLSRRINVSRLALRRRGLLPLPHRYTLGAFGTIRTSLPAFNYVRDAYGLRLYRYLLRELDLTEQLLAQPDVAVNILLLNDLFDLLSQRGFGEANFHAMGCHVTRVPANDFIFGEYQRFKRYEQVFEYTVEHVSRFYERNFEYRLSARAAKSVTFEVQPRAELVEALGRPIVDTRFTAVYRQGVAAAHPTYSQLPVARVFEQSCVHFGDRSMRFNLEWR